MSEEGDLQIEESVTGLGQSIWNSMKSGAAAVGNTFSQAFGGEGEVEGEGLGIGAVDEEYIDEDKITDPRLQGTGYELGFAFYRPEATRSGSNAFFFTTQLGDPFPSYHCNPSPNFPPRWTSIPGVKPPCEDIVAPRIRLGANELPKIHQTMARLREEASHEATQPEPKVINLTSQALGDPYQYEALVTFLDLNKSVTILNLSNNELEDILDLDLEHVKKLYLSDNSITSFSAIPDLPVCSELHLSRNFITGLSGLNTERFPKLEILNLSANPIDAHPNLAHLVREAVPTVKVLNGLNSSRRWEVEELRKGEK